MTDLQLPQRHRKNGDPVAFRLLVERLSDMIHSTRHRILMNPDDASKAAKPFFCNCS
ncbi:MAG: hypothetical protein Kow00107_07420 [Planctomycetota bacterium]